MKFKLGDFVRFLDEKREGYVTNIMNDTTVGVTDTDGFEIPVAVSNLTHVYGHQEENAAFNEQENEVLVDDTFREHGVFIAVAEDGKASAVAHLSVVNRSSYQLMFTLKTDRKGTYKGEFASVIPAKTAVTLYAANLGDLDNWPIFMIQALYFSTANIKPKAPLLVERKFRAKDFSTSKIQIPEINKYGWLIELDEQAPVIDAQKLKESFFSQKAEKHKVVRPTDEVDLHIEKLRDDHQFLSESEMLEIQLAYFNQVLDAAIVNQMPKIVIIHGVGNGTLRHHIHKIISKHPQVRTFMDARKEKFGFGATEIVFK